MPPLHQHGGARQGAGRMPLSDAEKVTRRRARQRYYEAKPGKENAPAAAERAVTAKQLMWLHENPQYEVTAPGREYADAGLLTAAGRFYGGTFPIPPAGSVAVGMLSAREREAREREERLAARERESG
jgi:hypothetical protein